MDYVTDTHALLWHLYWPKRLGAAARRVFEEADDGAAAIVVPAVAVAEMLMVAEKGRLPGVTVEILLPQLRRMAASDNYVCTDLIVETIIQSHTYTAIADIFDRLIVTEAVRHSVPLLTRDFAIRDSGLVTVIWD